MNYIIGMKITHKILGEGTIISIKPRMFTDKVADSDLLLIDFNGDRKWFSTVSIKNFIV